MCAPGHAEIPVHPQRSVIQQMVTEGLYMVANLTFTRTHTHTHTLTHTHTHTHTGSLLTFLPLLICAAQIGLVLLLDPGRGPHVPIIFQSRVSNQYSFEPTKDDLKVAQEVCLKVRAMDFFLSTLPPPQTESRKCLYVKKQFAEHWNSANEIIGKLFNLPNRIIPTQHS